MIDNINGRTPEEIKKVLECCYGNAERRLCEECPNAAKVEGYSEPICVDFDDAGENAIVYIKQLEDHFRDLTKKVEQLERERDAAVEDITRECHKCKHLKVWFNGCTPDYDCDRSDNCRNNDNWQWRGVPEDDKA